MSAAITPEFTAKEKEYMKRLWYRKGVLDIRLADTQLRDKQEITKELHALEWALLRIGAPTDGGNDAIALDAPMRTVTALDRFGLVTVHGRHYQVADIGMRMLSARELYRAQGFPDTYKINVELDGKRLSNKAQVRMVGNSVCPPVAAALARAQFEDQVIEVAA